MQKAAYFSAALHIKIDCLFGGGFLLLLCLYLFHFFRCPLRDMLIGKYSDEIGAIKMCFLAVA